MNEGLFHIREAHGRDLAAVDALSLAEDMGHIGSLQDVQVAVNHEDQVVGFIRLVFDDKGVCHVSPVVVYPTWRRFGVGRALVEGALGRHGELRLVSRGSSLAFYQSLGFEETPWETILGTIAHDCDECPIIEECKPVPLRKSLTHEGHGRA
ncbi:MAG: GNAT family N-acetyltransferase [Coriobacteriaceae bacterium]|jgi:GNAT superfamily N-acetyltransferase|nr:GNAT family N-acetyltransferase [Coriobacteriaceae bacterium]